MLPAARADSPVLVELFASQNCMSCPAAHRQMRALSNERADVLVLTWSVDYWDYLGGRDPMAIAESKERQRGYSERFSLRGPYTPQTVFAGREQCAGNRRQRIMAALDRASAAASAGVEIRRSGARVSLDGQTENLAEIWWVSFLKGAANTTDMVNPVVAAVSLGPWLGGRADIELPDCESGCALIVQEAGIGPVLAVYAVK